ncbi:hypothetical protein OJAV_G00175610 [Oryzias javanicus]|uniref:Uncharacterized protein n=1 Tax=Oryzias javanicus TaxID=123683 RepID=A0A3S2PAL1_ORYJA|nr:hypothetical protein OJAV_G00175610 [Oryzias javanicus]
MEQHSSRETHMSSIQTIIVKFQPFSHQRCMKFLYFSKSSSGVIRCLVWPSALGSLLRGVHTLWFPCGPPLDKLKTSPL